MPLAPSSPVNFRFAYGEIPVSGAITPDSARYTLSVEAVAGILPYSAEDPNARAGLLSVINGIARAEKDSIFVSRHQSIMVAARQSLEAPLTAVSVLSGLIVLMTGLRGRLEALAVHLPELGMALPARSAADRIGPDRARPGDQLA